MPDMPIGDCLDADFLAGNDDEQVERFQQLLTFYDSRSRIVHGDTLSEEHRNAIQNEADLRHVVRRLLLGFLRLATTDQLKKRFYLNLDTTLQHRARRHGLRVLMGVGTIAQRSPQSLRHESRNHPPAVV